MKELDEACSVIKGVKLTTTATTDGPEEIGVALLGHGDKATVGQDNLHGEDLISSQTVNAGQGRMATAEHVSTSNTDSLVDELVD